MIDSADIKLNWSEIEIGKIYRVVWKPGSVSEEFFKIKVSEIDDEKIRGIIDRRLVLLSFGAGMFIKKGQTVCVYKTKADIYEEVNKKMEHRDKGCENSTTTGYIQAELF